LSVIARNSSFQYRGSQRDFRQIGKELAAQYVVEGSLRKVGDRIRVTAQLIDATTGSHIWAQRYDRELKDIFEVQDDVTRCIAGAAATWLEDDRLKRSEKRAPGSLQAYDYWLRGRKCIAQTSAQGMAEARRYFELAIEADPHYARAYSGLAYVYNMSTSYSGWGIPFDEAYARAFDLAMKAVSLDDTDNMPHITLGWCLMWRGNYGESRREFDRALELNPNDADALIHRAFHLGYTGEAEQAIETVQKAIRLNPLRPHWYLTALRFAYLLARRCKEAIVTGEGVPDPWPEAPILMAVAYAYDDQIDNAKSAADRFVANIRAIWEGDPNAGPADYVKWWLSDNPYQFQKDIDYLLAGLRKAGLPV
jgi:tetratricopeptide (TPR) repeat protein